MRMPHVQQSFVEGRPHTSHVTTSCVLGSQCSPSPSNSSSNRSSPPGACARTRQSPALTLRSVECKLLLNAAQTAQLLFAVQLLLQR